VGAGADADAAPPPPDGWWSLAAPMLRFATTVVVGLVAVVPLVGNEHRVQDVDPVYMHNLVHRMGRYGGTIYENAIHNRGTFEPLLYDLARLVTTDAGYWFAVSAMVALLGTIIGAVAARTARVTGANPPVALAVAAVAYVQLTMATHGYSRVLYIRNITTTLLAVVWALALVARPWASRRAARWSSVAAGALLGLVLQQLLTSVVTAAVVGVVALVLLAQRRPRHELVGHIGAGVVAALVAFAATPLWYLLRGSFEEYWAGWWTYARYVGEGPGRSLGGQLGLGWDQLWAYHLRNPLVVLLLTGFIGLTWLLWDALDRRQRVVHLGLLAWFAAGWIELVLSQRYSPHYYAVVGIPTLLIAAATAGHVARAVAARRGRTRATVAAPLVATLLAIYLTGPATFVQQLRDTRAYRGAAQTVAERQRNLGGGDRTVRALLDLVSEDGSSLLAWTFDPSIYPRYQRVPATRFQWKFLYQGAIYLGRTRPEYVLPKTWQWFAEDVAESRPAAFVETEVPDPGTPFDALVERRYRPVYDGQVGRVWLRHDLVDDLLRAPAAVTAPAVGQPPSGSGWVVGDGDGRATFRRTVAEGPSRALPVGSGRCFRLDLTADAPTPGALVDLVVRFDDPARPEEEPQLLALAGDRAGSGSAGLGALGFEAVPVPVGDGPVRLAVVVGTRSAALLVDGAVAGAVRLPQQPGRLAVESVGAELELTDLRRSAAPAGGGCGAGA
jgi:hypothetical protein